MIFSKWWEYITVGVITGKVQVSIWTENVTEKNYMVQRKIKSRIRIMNHNIYFKNKKKSIQLKNKYSKYIRQNECYDNIYRLYSKYVIPNRTSIKIAYGFVDSGIDHVYVHHCFLMEGDIVIDPTLAELDTHYYIVKTYDASEYVEILQETSTSSFTCYKPYRDALYDFVKWGIKHDVYCIT